MKNNIHPCIWYDGNAKAAAEFYCSLFPNSTITADTSLVVNFEVGGQKFMGLNGGPMFTPNPSISFFVICESDEEINELWKQLSQNGKIMMPLDKYDWSERYGFLEDKFGLAWQLMKGNYSDVNQKITPSFLFTGDKYGKAEEAVKFYTALFPASSITGILLYGEGEEQAAGNVKHAQFILDDKVFMAMDGPGSHGFGFNEAISFVIECNDQEEVDFYWNNLTEDGGQESMCGWVKDKFGVSWQIIPAKLGELMASADREKANRAMQAMLKMKKIIIADLQKAYDGN